MHSYSRKCIKLNLHDKFILLSRIYTLMIEYIFNYISSYLRFGPERFLTANNFIRLK